MKSQIANAHLLFALAKQKLDSILFFGLIKERQKQILSKGNDSASRINNLGFSQSLKVTPATKKNKKGKL